MSDREAREVALSSGNVNQALRDAGIAVEHRDLAGLSCIFYPVGLGRPHGLLVLNDAEDHLRALALAHHYLEHRSLPYYAYGPDGAAVYDAPRERRAATDWALEFGAHCQPPMDAEYET